MGLTAALNLASIAERAVKALERIATAAEDANEFNREQWRIQEWKESAK